MKKHNKSKRTFRACGLPPDAAALRRLTKTLSLNLLLVIVQTGIIIDCGDQTQRLAHMGSVGYC